MVSTALSPLRCETAQSAKSLKLLGRQIACFGAGDSVNHGIISGVIGHCLEFPDRCHHPKEDHILRKLRERDVAAAQAVVPEWRASPDLLRASYWISRRA